MIIIGDVHGELKTLEKLLNILPQTKDICFVGDLIDRGPNSKEVINLVIQNKWNCVLGNHEDMATDPSMEEIWLYNGGWQTFQSFGTADDFRNAEEFQFIKNLPLTIQYKDFIISHSFCWDGDSTTPNDILWGRSFMENNCTKTNIFGHTPLKEAKKIHDKHWMIDTGCTFGNKLSAIDLETEEIFCVGKIDE